jgi:predicted ribosome quality control (RQC) complex YloA/Tae2 family protein
MKKVSVYIDCIKSTIDYSIGGNAKENFELIDNAMPNDLWFHVDGLPSEHVIASIPENLDIDRKQRLKIAKQGAVLCKQHSKYASQKNVSIVYTEIQNVTKTEVLGQVEISNSKLIVI